MGNICSSRHSDAIVPVVKAQIRIEETTLKIQYGDICLESADAIIYPTFANLEIGGNPGKALIMKAGYTVENEITEKKAFEGPFEVGSAVVTESGKLDCKSIVHAVCPIYIDGEKNEKTILQKAIQASLESVEALGLKSICFYPLGSGIFGFPHEECVEILLNCIFYHLASSSYIHELKITDKDIQLIEKFKNYLEQNFPEISKGEIVKLDESRLESLPNPF